ncbi:MAG TPA: BREX-1 system phosphatase PglZ type A [Bacteroidales bacterium]|nr:BREX-1 system phosphatase PglZ type A [Bacteroidales bacterium]
MLEETINKIFQRNPRLHILFYFDETGNQRTAVENLNIPGLTVEFVEENWLYIQHKYHHPKPGERVLLYLNRKSPEKGTYHDFPLLGLLRANRELLPDDVDMLMEDYQLQIHQKSLVQKYKTELGWMKTKELFKAGNILGANFTEANVQHGLLSTFLNFKKPESKELLIAKLLTYSLPSKEEELKKFLRKVNENKLSDVLKTYIHQYFDFAPDDFTQASLADLIRRMKYNSIVQGLGYHKNDPYQNLRIRNSECMPTLNSLRETGFKLKDFNEAFELHGALVKETEIVKYFGMSASYAYYSDKLTWAIVEKMLPILQLETESVEERVDNLLTHHDKEGSLFFTLSFLKHVTALYRLTKQVGSKKWDTPEEYLKRYTEELYQIDFHHRKALYNFKKIDLTATPFDDEFKKIKNSAEQTYNRFISELNGEWLACLASVDFDFRQIVAPKQYDFFEKVVLARKQKTVVIISDALRYEVANELLTELHKDEKNVSKLSYSLASIPSVTSVGMANLLPGEKYMYGSTGEVKVEGMRSSDTSDRELILQKNNSNAKAVSFDTVEKNEKSVNRELFRNEIVYIYHDVIDKTGHRGDEKSVFLDTQRAIEELAIMVKLILGGMGVSRLIITADHGFLYTEAEIKEVDKNKIVECNTTEKSARHYVTSDHIDVESGYKIALFKTSKFQEPFHVVIPYSTNRFKVAGARYQFVHGGGSLQELVVPVIESTRKKEALSNKVNPILLGRNLSVVSNVLKFQLLQDNPISATEKERVITIKLFAGNEQVSETQEVVLNFVGEQPGERIKQIVIPLTVSTSEAVLKLKIFDKSDELNPLIDENIKNSTLIGRDF